MFGTYLPMVYTLLAMCLAVFVGRAAFGLEARLTGGYSFQVDGVQKGNMAVTIRQAGMLAGLVIAVFFAYQPSYGLVDNLKETFALLTAALFALIISRHINDRFILSTVKNDDEVVKERNVSVAIVETTTFIATAVIFAGGMADPTHGFIYNVAWFVIGQSVLVGLAKAYTKLAPSIYSGVVSDNRACALSFGGLLLAAGIVIGSIIHGSSAGWGADIVNVAISLLLWLIVVVAAKLVLQHVIFRGTSVSKEIEQVENWAVGMTDAALVLAFTAAFIYVHAA